MRFCLVRTPFLWLLNYAATTFEILVFLKDGPSDPRWLNCSASTSNNSLKPTNWLC